MPAAIVLKYRDQSLFKLERNATLHLQMKFSLISLSLAAAAIVHALPSPEEDKTSVVINQNIVNSVDFQGFNFSDPAASSIIDEIAQAVAKISAADVDDDELVKRSTDTKTTTTYNYGYWWTYTYPTYTWSYNTFCYWFPRWGFNHFGSYWVPRVYSTAGCAAYFSGYSYYNQFSNYVYSAVAYDPTRRVCYWRYS